MKQLIQVAGVLDERELQLFFDLKVDDIAFPVGPGVRTPDMPVEKANALVQTFPEGHASVAIVYLNTAATLQEFFSRYSHFDKIQLHETIAIDELRAFREAMPNFHLTKTLAIGEKPFEELEREAAECAPYVDAFLADTFDSKTKARGATGIVHDWSLSRQLREVLTRPLILAGGLNPKNVANAIQAVSPMAVDVHSGVEGADGRKDRAMLRQFIDEARNAFLLMA